MKIRPNFTQSLFFKFSVAFLVAGLLPIFVLSMLSLYQFTGQIERHTVNNIQQMMVYMRNNVNDMLRKYDDISNLMYTKAQPDDIFLKKSSELYPSGFNSSAMDDFIKTVLFSDANIQNVLFVRSEDGTLNQQSRGSKQMDPFVSYPPIEWNYTLTTNPKKLAVFPYHMEAYYNSQDLVMTFARSWIDTSRGVQNPVRIYGTLFLDIDVNVFDSLLQQSRLGKKDEIFIVNENGIILYSNRRDKIGSRFDEFGVKARGDMIVFSEPLPYIQGKVVGLMSKEDIYSPIIRTKNSVWVAALASFAALFLMGLMFSRMFTRPILQLIRQMIKVESGNLDIEMKVGRKDEMGRLANGFNRMVERLKEYINDAYINEIKRKQSELNALKSQIRPHYLYNTLEVIRMSAVANGDRKVADMIHALSDQLQYVIDYGDESVTLEQELEHLRHYFHLIEVRFDHRISLQVELQSPELTSASVLKLILQPIVENAVHHGIRPKGGKGIVLITIERLEGDILGITIYDDGAGMEQEQLESLRIHLNNQDRNMGKSIGIKNVHERIKAAYGSQYGLDMESRPHIGTSVRILLPLNLEVRHEHDSNDSR
ncbi:sensor histidine kinase [Paenibacillus silvae]|uniref:cache domain-containing sensor histidine kinase n=1 Tax=Paenibacillus silvae TaxID=1325358 RepID=UPI0025A22325|nr:sensor histidine kinase [Paenibacillus silvae]MDM5277466.1 sensor histidine kinase [Paenibacillus silvae]